MAEDFDVEAAGLLDGLEGKARTERAELVEWLIAEGLTVEQIRVAFMPQGAIALCERFTALP